MSEASKTTAKTATKTAAKQSTHAAKNVNKAAEAVVESAVNSRDLRFLALGLVGATAGTFAVNQARAYIAKRKLQKEIDRATSDGHESRESRA